MKYIRCPECGILIEISNKTCSNCGFPFTGEETIIAIKICPECNALVERNAQSCDNCGFPFENKDKYEQLIKEMEQKVRYQELRAIEAERKLVDSQKKIEENERKFLEAEKKLTQLTEKESDNSEVTYNESYDGVNLLPFLGDLNSNTDNDLTKHNNHNRFSINKRNIIVLSSIIFLIAIVVIFIVFRGTPVESIKLEYENASLQLGNYGKIDYTITPSDASNKEVQWESSNESIVEVDDNGLLRGVSEGTCDISVIASNGKTAVCSVTVEPAGPDLYDVYTKYCDSGYASVAADGSYLSIDTDPDSYIDYEDEAILSIIAVNKALGVPDSVVEKMGSTRAIDGIQTQVCGDIEVRWSYHPKNGLEVIYSTLE